MGLGKILFSWNQNIGLLLLRLGLGACLAFAHGLAKLTNYDEYSAQFGDPLGFGPAPTLVLAIIAEFFCALAVMAGLYTRLASLMIMGVMATAFFIVHAEDPFLRKELALLFLTGFTALFFTGPGKYSVDAKIGRVS